MPSSFHEDLFDPDRKELLEGPAHSFSLDRREWIGALGAGLLISASGKVAHSQDASPGAAVPPASRLHIAEDGTITVFSGKVDFGQGSRGEILQAAAEELRVAPAALRIQLADTDRTPDDGSTAGSRTTPSTIPVVRRACAGAREMLLAEAARLWSKPAAQLEAVDGIVREPGGERSLSYADLARAKTLVSASDGSAPRRSPLTPVDEWTRLGRPLGKIRARAIVSGAHRYPSDIVRPDMVYGAVLRAPGYGRTLRGVDLAAAEAHGAEAVRDGDFVGCTAPTSYAARQAVAALAKTAEWDRSPHPSSDEIPEHLRRTARTSGSGRAGPRVREEGDVAARFAAASKTYEASYSIPYIQHVPMEPRAAAAEWSGGKLTVWTGTQRPFGVREQLMEAFHLPASRVRVINPDTGGGFGGKHTGEAAIEAARLAKAAGRPVLLRWTRQEELAWAYFRPAGVFEAKAVLNGDRIAAWDFAAYNVGTAAIETPYAVGASRTRYLPCESPLREGSYRGIAAVGNTYAREVFMDELAEAAGVDPLAFRLANCDDGRLRNVLTAAADRFGRDALRSKGAGIAAGFEKGSYVAICAQVRVVDERVDVERLVVAFECGKILNPLNLRAQVEGCVIQGLGGALMEEVRFENGRLLTAKLADYPVPRFRDVPPIDALLLDRPDLDPTGAGETPIIAVAPALAAAVRSAAGVRVRSLPLRGRKLTA